MYAIIESGGKQYRVEQGTKLRVETLPYEQGQEFNVDRVLLFQGADGLQIGKPHVSVAVTAEVVAHDRAKKIIVFKKRSKKTYKKTQGHRQNYTEIVIKSIGGTPVAAAAATAEKKDSAPPAPERKTPKAPKKSDAPAARPEQE